MVENLVLCIDHINQHLSKPHLVLVTGDIASTGQAEELNHAANLLNRFEMPFFYVIPAVVVKPVDGPYLFEEQDVIRSQQPYTLFYP